MACRDPEIAEEKRQLIMRETGNIALEIVPVNLASLSSTASFANELLQRGEVITLLMNNAGDEAHRILARAEKEVALEKDKVRDEMKQEMVQVASMMAGKLVSESISEEAQAKLIEETCNEMGDSTWQS